MTAYLTNLNTDPSGVKTSSEYGDRGDGTSTWFQHVKLATGAAPGIESPLGTTSASAAADSSSTASIVALLKALLREERDTGRWHKDIATHQAVSATGADSATVATLTATVGQRTYITGFSVTGLGATGQASATVTVAGLTGGSLVYTIDVPAGVSNVLTPLVVDFAIPIAASADNTAITVTATAFGAGNTLARVNARGLKIT